MTPKEHKIIFFHVGFPKTASTFLQLNVFPYFKGIEFVKKHDFKRRDEIIKHTTKDRILLSLELDLDRKGGIRNMKDVAGKYPNTFPIVVLRRHASWLRSKYKYYIRKHGYRTFEEYFHPEDSNSILSNENLRYFPKIKLLEQHFNTKPLVLFQEELKHKPFAFINIIAEYTGATYSKEDINVKTIKKAYSDKQLKLVRKFNRAYKFDKSKVKSKGIRFLYQKFSAFLLHSVAYIGALIPEKIIDKRDLIPSESLIMVNNAYKEDWEKCIQYAKESRKLYLPQDQNLEKVR
jgi:hypothetical protein